MVTAGQPFGWSWSGWVCADLPGLLLWPILSLMAPYHCSAVTWLAKHRDRVPCSAAFCLSGQCRMTVHCSHSSA